jgi:GAF domain-containing protein
LPKPYSFASRWAVTVDQIANTGEQGEIASARAVLDFCQVAWDVESVEGLYSAALAALQRAIGVQRSSILVMDGRGVMRFGAWRGLSEAYRKAVEGHSPWAADAKDPEPILVSDVALDPVLAPFGPVFAAEGIAALAFIPLVHAGRQLGKFIR